MVDQPPAVVIFREIVQHILPSLLSWKESRREWRTESTGKFVSIPFIYSTSPSSFRDSTIANVRLSVCQSQKPLSLSELPLSAIEPIVHQAYQPSRLSPIKPIDH